MCTRERRKGRGEGDLIHNLNAPSVYVLKWRRARENQTTAGRLPERERARGRKREGSKKGCVHFRAESTQPRCVSEGYFRCENSSGLRVVSRRGSTNSPGESKNSARMQKSEELHQRSLTHNAGRVTVIWTINSIDPTGYPLAISRAGVKHEAVV